MNNVIYKLAATGLLALAAGSAGAEVVVNYVQPEQFSDLPSLPKDRQQALNELTRHFAKLAAQLPEGQILRVDVADVDMAGREIPGTIVLNRRTYSSSVDWPRIRLQYEVENQGQIVRSGEVDLRDMAFSYRAKRYYDGDLLRFEKQMLDDWFKESILSGERSAQR